MSWKEREIRNVLDFRGIITYLECTECILLLSYIYFLTFLGSVLFFTRIVSIMQYNENVDLFLFLSHARKESICGIYCLCRTLQDLLFRAGVAFYHWVERFRHPAAVPCLQKHSLQWHSLSP